MNKSESKRGNRGKLAVLMIALGLICIVSAASLFTYNRMDENRADSAAMITAQALAAVLQANGSDAAAEDEQNGLDNTGVTGSQSNGAQSAGDLVFQGAAAVYVNSPANAVNMAAQETTLVYEGNSYLGLITIPELSLSLPVMDEWSYPNLRISPCRYTGSVAENDLVIAAHNYSRHFGNINRLSDGDLVIFTDADGVDHRYLVAEVTTLNPADISGMTDSGYALTLFTCTYSGQARVTVRCVPEDTEG
ncbi:MAG: sortase [Defluviitaleaceae bacterium]|nr:sortase [Defluviitaleaceae bacterium]